MIDDDLMEEALDSSGIRTKKEVVEEGLKLLIKLNKQAEIKKFRGLLKWEGDLEKHRLD